MSKAKKIEKKIPKLKRQKKKCRMMKTSKEKMPIISKCRKVGRCRKYTTDCSNVFYCFVSSSYGIHDGSSQFL